MSKRKSVRSSKQQELRGIIEGYRSGFEERIHRELTALGVSFEYETLKIKWTEIKNRTYTPDFILPNGIIIETKGRFVNTDRQKHLAVKKQHPEYDIRFVFQNPNNRIYKGSKTTYGMWADKHKFKWAKGSIPQEWINEPKREESSDD